MIKLKISNFTDEIQKIVAEKNVSYMEAVVLYAEQNGYETDQLGKLINKTPNKAIKEKIEEEAKALNYLPKTSKLNIFNKPKK